MNVRLLPPILIVIGSLIFVLVTATFFIRNQTSTKLKAAASGKMELQGKLMKWPTCKVQFVCHYVISKFDNQIYNINSKYYPGISSKNFDLEPLIGKEVSVSGIWVSGEPSYLVVANID